jgi:mono/diheme cytochrome c family protein
MKPSRFAVILICALSAAGLAQEATQDVSRTLPVRLNPAPPPDGATPRTPPLPPESIARTPAAQAARQARTNPPAPVPSPPLPNTVLAWDSETKEYNAKSGEAEAHYTFYFTNISAAPVVITSAAASCGCTVPKLPPLPWTNAPGAKGEIPVTMVLAGKPVGVTFKTVTVNTDKGPKILNVKVTIEPPPAAPVPVMNRDANQKAALADRQAIFKGDCVSCHVEKGRGKIGRDLYVASCGICHESEHRATMVPDLHALNHDTNADFWKTWISQGKPGSMMPAFAVSEGGPLNDAQINSLVQYLSTAILAQPVKRAAAQ